MLGYLCLGLFVLVVSLLTFQDRTMSSGLICERNKLTNIYDGSACAQGNNVPSIIFDINEYLFFDFIEYNFKDGKSRNCESRASGGNRSTSQDQCYNCRPRAWCNEAKFVEALETEKSYLGYVRSSA